MARARSRHLRADALPLSKTETISLGGLQVRFLRSKDQTGGSLDVFEMTVQPDARTRLHSALGYRSPMAYEAAREDTAAEP